MQQNENELIIRIKENGEILVEDIVNGVKGYKKVSPDTFIDCVKNSIRTNMISSGVLPAGTFSYSVDGYGDRYVCVEFPSRYCDVVYENTEYKDFPLPRLVFGFRIKNDRIISVNLGVPNEGMLTPKTKMFVYPFSNVSGFRLCCGTNRLPDIKSLHQLTGVMYYIMSMPNNNDHYSFGRTKLGLELRHLFETLSDKTPEYYYTDVLCESEKTLQDFIKS